MLDFANCCNYRFLIGLRNVFDWLYEGIFGNVIDGFPGLYIMSEDLSNKGINIRLTIAIGYRKNKANY